MYYKYAFRVPKTAPSVGTPHGSLLRTECGGEIGRSYLAFSYIISCDEHVKTSFKITQLFLGGLNMACAVHV